MHIRDLLKATESRLDRPDFLIREAIDDSRTSRADPRQCRRRPSGNNQAARRGRPNPSGSGCPRPAQRIAAEPEPIRAFAQRRASPSLREPSAARGGCARGRRLSSGYGGCVVARMLGVERVAPRSCNWTGGQGETWLRCSLRF